MKPRLVKSATGNETAKPKLVKLIGGSGEGGGVPDYADAVNKPSINGVELYGNKTLKQLGITKLIEDELAKFNHLDYDIVDSLPATGEPGVRYMVKHPTDDRYEEYIWDDDKWYDIGSSEEIDMTDYYNKMEIDETLDTKQNKLVEEQLIGWTKITPGTYSELDMDSYSQERFTILVYIRKSTNRQSIKFELTKAELQKLISKATTNELVITRSMMGVADNTKIGMLKQTIKREEQASNKLGILKIKYQAYEADGTVISGLDNFEFCMYAE